MRLIDSFSLAKTPSSSRPTSSAEAAVLVEASLPRRFRFLLLLLRAELRFSPISTRGDVVSSSSSSSSSRCSILPMVSSSQRDVSIVVSRLFFFRCCCSKAGVKTRKEDSKIILYNTKITRFCLLVRFRQSSSRRVLSLFAMMSSFTPLSLSLSLPFQGKEKSTKIASLNWVSKRLMFRVLQKTKGETLFGRHSFERLFSDHHKERDETALLCLLLSKD